MSSADYASAIRGFRLFRESGDRSEYQAATGYSYESVVRLFTDLPNHCEICFFDPDEKREEAHVFVRRIDSHYKVMRARHGNFSKWKEEPLPQIVALFEESPLVKNPSESFESFRVSLIPDHQRQWHVDGRLGHSSPWWHFWK